MHLLFRPVGTVQVKAVLPENQVYCRKACFFHLFQPALLINHSLLILRRGKIEHDSSQAQKHDGGTNRRCQRRAGGKISYQSHCQKRHHDAHRNIAHFFLIMLFDVPLNPLSVIIFFKLIRIFLHF